MLHLACQIPHNIVIACSGGPDSMALLSFCQAGKKNITVLHINHGTQHAKDASELVEDYCQKNDLRTYMYDYPANQPHTEEAWREFRLEIYREWASKDKWIATAHHLDDAVEWYLLSSLHGKANFMKPVDEEFKLIKPFLYTEKNELINWCVRKHVPFVIDPTNLGEHNARAILREKVMPELLKIHPGMKTSIKNKMI